MNRLFQVEPQLIFECPSDEVVVGPIKGWECYAPDFNTGGVIGPFDAVVVLDDCTHMPCIIPPGQRYPFFFDKVGGRGHTLRFIRKREVVDEVCVATCDG